jgi:hypothetical protein
MAAVLIHCLNRKLERLLAGAPSHTKPRLPLNTSTNKIANEYTSELYVTCSHTTTITLIKQAEGLPEALWGCGTLTCRSSISCSGAVYSGKRGGGASITFMSGRSRSKRNLENEEHHKREQGLLLAESN